MKMRLWKSGRERENIFCFTVSKSRKTNSCSRTLSFVVQIARIQFLVQD